MVAYSAFAIVRRLASCRRHYLGSAIQLFAIIHNGCCAILASESALAPPGAPQLAGRVKVGSHAIAEPS